MTKPLFILFIVLFNTAVYSQSVTHLYDAQVPVETRSEAALNQGFKDALTQVLIKLSGDRHTPTRPDIQANSTIGGEQNHAIGLQTGSIGDWQRCCYDLGKRFGDGGIT